MSKGKYSPSLNRYHLNQGYENYCYNADGNIPPEWTLEMKEAGEVYNTRLYFGNYDSEGYDSYDYSAFNENGDYVGMQNGIDRWGYTEEDYLEMDDDDFNWLSNEPIVPLIRKPMD